MPFGIDFSWILVDFGSQVEPSWHGKSTQNRSKIDEKDEVMMGRHLDIDFSWILVDFESQVEAKLEASWP